MVKTNIFEKALAIQSPWYVKDIQFNVDAKRLDIYIDFTKGSTFPQQNQSIPIYTMLKTQ